MQEQKQDFTSWMSYVQNNQSQDRQLESMHQIEMMTIDPATISDVVGKQGKVINRIITETGVKIDITDDGNVSIWYRCQI